MTRMVKLILKDDFIDSTNIFGGTKKVILSKNFKGGDVVEYLVVARLT